MDSSERREASSTDCIAIVIPVFNDWESLTRVLSEIDTVLGVADLRGTIIVVDDGSTMAVSDEFINQKYLHLLSVDVIRLVCNLGHQRAIATGLAHLATIDLELKSIAVMDGDGQDRPEDIPRLVDELTKRQCSVVFAVRTKRSEEFAFRLMYRAYRLVFWLLTGIPIRWGNFSVLSPSALPGLLVLPDFWNHFAGAVIRSRVRFSTVALSRGKRHSGESHMRYSSLVIHGMSAIAIFGDVVAARLMIWLSGLLASSVVLFGAELIVRFHQGYSFTQWVIPATSVLILFLLQGLLSTLIFTLILLNGRSQARVVPSRDALTFVKSVARVFPQR